MVPRFTRPATLAMMGMFALGSPGTAGQLDGELETLLDTAPAEDWIPAIVVLADQVDVAGLEREIETRGYRSRWRRHQHVLRTARATAEATQPAIADELHALEARDVVRDVRGFWIVNAFALLARPATLHDIADRSDVETIYHDAPVKMREGLGASPDAIAGRRGTDAALDAVNVHPAWTQGYTGAGRLVCLFDQGANGNHVAYADRWRGTRPEVPWYHAWNDPYQDTDFPWGSGSAGHGTMVLGVMVANPPDEPPIGVAHDAEWISGLVFTQSGGVSSSAIIGLYEWAADPDSNLATVDDVPDVVNNSWGTDGDCSTTFWDAIDVVEAAGVVNIVAVANSGPASGSVHSPESRATSPFSSFSVGNLDPHSPGWPINPESGRGPTQCEGVTPRNAIKPELTAPGTNIRSTYPGDDYRVNTGASFAAPFVSGTVALLRQVNPDLTVDQIKSYLMATAHDLGDPGEDNTYGWGILDIGSAVNLALSTTTPLRPPTRTTADSTNVDEVTVRWLAPIFADANAARPTGYDVYRAGPDGDFPDTPVGSTAAGVFELVESGVADGEHLYVVTARYDTEESGPSRIARVTITATAPGDRVSTAPTVAYLTSSPNPFRPFTTLAYDVSPDEPARLTVHDVGGRMVRSFTLQNGGGGEVLWDGRDEVGRAVPPGVYFAQLEQGGTRLARRMVRLR